MLLQEVRNTSMIEIGIFDTDSQRAANIAAQSSLFMSIGLFLIGRAVRSARGDPR